MITIDNLAFSYGTKAVLKNISMTLQEGRIYGLLGENGVGKTTLLTLLCGLKKPLSGRILTDGMLPYDRQPALLQGQYYLPDDVSPQGVTAETFARQNGRFWPRFDLKKFWAVQQEFETPADKKMDTLSAGQLKKTYISFALATNARYLFMDEPTNGLDIPSKSQFRSAITKYTAEDSTIVISTHQVRDLENIIDPIIILDNQEVLLNASMEDIAARLYFEYGEDLHPDALYCEPLPGGFIQVCPNPDGAESRVHIEALFNAVHRNKELVKSLFKNA